MRFALVGAAGFVAPRHLAAIHTTGNQLVAALDPNDSVGVLDSHFPDARFFTEPERLDRHLEKLRRRGEGVHFVSICSPNHLHDAHCRLALRVGAHAICEKPVVINPWNLEALQELEREYERRVFVMLQLRLHPVIAALRQRCASGHHSVDLHYITPRGLWYHVSWKGSEEKSGGLALNIGVHFFDMLQWLFGACTKVTVEERSPQRVRGSFRLDRAEVRWLLSIDRRDLEGGAERNRLMAIDGERVDFTSGFENLHTRVYEEVLAGRGFTLEDAGPGIEIAHAIRSATL